MKKFDEESKRVIRVAFTSHGDERRRRDTIIVVSYDVANQKVGMISIPRDTAVNRDWRKDPKINGAYAGVT